MPRSFRNVVLFAKVETTSGTDAAPTPAADSVLLYFDNLNLDVAELFAERDVIRGGFGAPDKLPYTRRGNISFSVDLAGSGALGTAPQWGDLLIGCGCAETISAGARVEYTPASTALKTLTIWAYVDGVLLKFAYCAGSFKLGLSPGKVPTIDFSFTALVSSIAAGTNPAPTLTPWVRPQAVGPAFTTALKLGGTYTAGVLSGGTDYNFGDFQFDAGNDVQDLVLAATETVNVYNRAPKLSTKVDLPAATVVSMHTNMHGGTNLSVGVVHGSVAGNKVLVYMPTGVIDNVADDKNGNVLMTKMDFTIPPGPAGNDDFRIVSL